MDKRLQFACLLTVLFMLPSISLGQEQENKRVFDNVADEIRYYIADAGYSKVRVDQMWTDLVEALAALNDVNPLVRDMAKISRTQRLVNKPAYRGASRKL